MSDQLDALPDAALNELFSVEVAGWHRGNEVRDKTEYRGYWYSDGPGVEHIGTFAPPFCTDATAVLPWLAKSHSWQSLYDQGEMREYTVDVWAPNHGNAAAATFARAAVIALIRAKRSSKGAA